MIVGVAVGEESTCMSRFHDGVKVAFWEGASYASAATFLKFLLIWGLSQRALGRVMGWKRTYRSNTARSNFFKKIKKNPKAAATNCIRSLQPSLIHSAPTATCETQ